MKSWQLVFDVMVWWRSVYPKLLLLIVVLALLVFIYRMITKILSKGLLRHAKTAKEKANTKVFLGLWKFFFCFLMILLLIFTYSGSLTGFGISAGFIGVILGWALQKPITGIAAWLMIITTKPFRVGDRVVIDGVKGDVIDITLTHIYLDEAGGTISAEEKSGRSVMIPCSTLFEKNFINYTLTDDYILDEVVAQVTYESDIKKARRLCVDAANEVVQTKRGKIPKKPYTRILFAPSGIDIKTRYPVIAGERESIKSQITQEIFDKIAKNKKVEIAYPHTEVIFRKKK